MKNKLFYFGYYCNSRDIPERKMLPTPADTAKMKYLAKVLSYSHDVTIVSPGFSTAYGKFERTRLSSGDLEVVYLETFGDGKPYISIKKIVSYSRAVGKFISTDVPSGSKAVVYNQPINTRLIKSLGEKNINPILEIEELNSTNQNSSFFKRLLYRLIEEYSLRRSEAFILVNSIIENQVKKGSKEYVLCYGDYSFNGCDKRAKVANSERLTVIYSGGIDIERGVFFFLNSLKSLSYNYKDRISVKISGTFHGRRYSGLYSRFFRLLSDCRENGVDVEYVGLLDEDEFERFVKESHICVSPQLAKSSFAANSFPSKILKYLSHGKIVVSSGTESVKSSPIRDLLFIYSNDNERDFLKVLAYVIDNYSMLSKEIEERISQSMKMLHSDFSDRLIRLLAGAHHD